MKQLLSFFAAFLTKSRQYFMYFLAKQSTFLWKHLIYSMRIYLYFSPFSLSLFLSLFLILSLSFSLFYSLSLPFSLSVSLSLSVTFILSLTFPQYLSLSLSIYLSIFLSVQLSSLLSFSQYTTEHSMYYCQFIKRNF